MRFSLRHLKRLAPLTLAVMLILAIAAPSAFAQLSVKANHDDIKINYNYHGSTVSVSGISDPGVDLILRISAAPGSEKMMRKDKIGGFLWMNVEEIHLNNIPELYFLRSTQDPSKLLSAEKLRAENIGLEAVTDNTEITPLSAPDKKQTLSSDFIKYQESRDKFAEWQGGIDLKPADGGGQAYYTLFDWPYQATPGTYDVTAYAVKDGNIVDKATTSVLVENVGEVQTLSEMATNNGALYGAAAIVVAIAAGFGVGVVFRSGGGAH